MSTPHAASSGRNRRIEHSLDLRTDVAERDAAVPSAPQIDNGDEHRYPDKCGTYSKAIKQSGIGKVDLVAYRTFKKAVESGRPEDFDHIILGGTRTLNGPQGGLAYQMACLDGSQFNSPPAPALASEEYAAELVELYWASLLRDVAFTDYPSDRIAAAAAAELSSLKSYVGPRTGAGTVTPDLLFRGQFCGETIGPYLSQFLLKDTALGALPITQKYLTYAPKTNFMLDATSFQQVQNGQPTGQSLNQQPTPVYLHDGRGLGAYTRVDVLYEAYLIAYLVLNSMNAPLNPGNPYLVSKTQNGFATFGQPDIASVLATVASAALKAVWYQKWNVHLRHRPESGGALVYLSLDPTLPKLDGKPSSTVLHSKAVQTCLSHYNSALLSQAFPEGSPTHPAYPTGHGAVAGACITVLKFFFDGKFVIPAPKIPSNDGNTLAAYTGSDAAHLTVNGELNKLATNISFGHGIHPGIHWRSDTTASIQLGESVALSLLSDLADTYNEKFTVSLQKVDGAIATLSNIIRT